MSDRDNDKYTGLLGYAVLTALAVCIIIIMVAITAVMVHWSWSAIT